MGASIGRAAAILLGLVFRFRRDSSPMKVLAEDAPTVSANGGGCSNDGGPLVDPLSLPHWNGWGVENGQHRFQPAEMAQLAVEDVPRLKLKWTFGFPGVSRVVAQPTIFGGRLFIGTQSGKVYSLDAKSGCSYWQFDAGKPVRSAIVVGPLRRLDGLLRRRRRQCICGQILTGKALWQVQIDDHPAAMITGAPTLVGTTLFVPVSSFEEVTGANPAYSCCSFRGSVVALEAATGKVLWKAFAVSAVRKGEPDGKERSRHSIEEGALGAGVWSAPTFDASSHNSL